MYVESTERKEKTQMVEILKASVINKTWVHMAHGKIWQLQPTHLDNLRRQNLKSLLVWVLRLNYLHSPLKSSQQRHKESSKEAKCIPLQACSWFKAFALFKQFSWALSGISCLSPHNLGSFHKHHPFSAVSLLFYLNLCLPIP